LKSTAKDSLNLLSSEGAIDAARNQLLGKVLFDLVGVGIYGFVIVDDVGCEALRQWESLYGGSE
jgi:hypothetical protein